MARYSDLTIDISLYRGEPVDKVRETLQRHYPGAHVNVAISPRNWASYEVETDRSRGRRRLTVINSNIINRALEAILADRREQ